MDALQTSISAGSELASFLYGFPEYLDDVTCVGRDDDTDQLLQLLQINKRVLITGVDGIGKTTIALHCVNKWIREGHFKHAIKIDTGTAQTANHSFNRLKTELSRVLSNENIYNILNEKIQSEKILMIFDNIEEAIVSNYLPGQERDNYYVLGTSKLVDLNEIFETYPLEKLSEESAVELFMGMFEHDSNIHNQIVDVRILLRQLDYLPLAVRHAAAFFKNELDYTIKHYMERLNELCPVEGCNNRALQINIQRAAENEHAQTLLNVMSFLNPNEICFELLLRLNEFTMEDCREAERHLRKFSLIGGTKECEGMSWIKQFLNIHPSVLYIVRSIMDIDTRNEILPLVFGIIINKMDLHGEFVLPYMDERLIDVGYKLIFRSGNYLQEDLSHELDRVGFSLPDIVEWRAVHYAAYMGHYDIIKKLCIEQTDALSYVTPTTGWTVLHAAALRRRGLSYLLKNLPSSVNEPEPNLPFCSLPSLVNAQTKIGEKAAIHIAVQAESAEDLEALINLGCDVNLGDSEGNTALHIAAKTVASYERIYSCKTVETLVSHGADLNTINNSGNAPVYLAAWNEAQSAVQTLIDAGCKLSTSHYNQLSLYKSARSDIIEWNDVKTRHLHVYEASCIKLFVVFACKSHTVRQHQSLLLSKLVNEEDGVKILKLFTGLIDEDEELLHLVHFLNNIMVALPIAAYYVHENCNEHNRNHIYDYRCTKKEGLRSKQLINLINQFIPSTIEIKATCPEQDSCTNTFKLIWMVIDTLESRYPDAFTILSYVSYLSPLIEGARLLHYLQMDEEKITRGLKVLRDFLLITNFEGREWWNSTHKLCDIVGTVAREYIHESGLQTEICNTILRAALDVKDNYQEDMYITMQYMSMAEIRSVYEQWCRGSGRWSEVLRLLRRLGCDVSEDSSWTLYHYAAADNRSYYFVWTLMDRMPTLKTDLNMSVCGITPLHITCLCGYLVPMSSLLKMGVDVHVRTNEQLTTLHMAAAAPREFARRIINDLLHAGVDVHTIDSFGRTPLQIATQYGQTAKVIGLLNDKH